MGAAHGRDTPPIHEGECRWPRRLFRWSLAAVAHAGCAIAAILIWIVHVYAAIWVKGTLRGMTSGSVSGGWAWKHHRKWFRQEVGKP